MSSCLFFVKSRLGLAASVSCIAIMQVSSVSAATPVAVQKATGTHIRPASGQGAQKAHGTIPAAAPESIKVSVGRAVRFRHEQHVPDSATHITGKELVERNVRAMTDLIRVAPNLSIQPSNGSAGLNFMLRGVGMADLTQNNIPSVMPYVDGVALPVTVMTSAIMYDMDNVSVNPGQSGFTHGMTTTGGRDQLPYGRSHITVSCRGDGRYRKLWSQPCGRLHIRSDITLGFLPHFGHVDDGRWLPA